MFICPILSCYSNTCSCFINNESNLLLFTNFSDLLVEKRSCKLASNECNWLNDDCFDFVKSVFSFFDHWLELLDTSFFFGSIVLLICTHWEFHLRERALSPIECWNSDTSKSGSLDALSSKSFSMIWKFKRDHRSVCRLVCEVDVSVISQVFFFR